MPVLVVVQDFRYERRRPERTTLYQVVQGNLETLQAASEEGLSSALRRVWADVRPEPRRAPIRSLNRMANTSPRQRRP